MSKLIQKAGFLNPKRAGRYMNYIATRDGVELLDENADSIYMRYIATRPRAEKHGEHGLFGAEDAVDLEKTLGELKAHEGNVWTIIYSLRREDAARLGYDNAASWRALLRSKQADLAEAMQIPPSQLRWYAAFHDEGEHPHIHMMLWSDDPKYGFLRKDKLLHLQSILTTSSSPARAPLSPAESTPPSGPFAMWTGTPSLFNPPKEPTSRMRTGASLLTT